jgi:hypothetical protein
MKRLFFTLTIILFFSCEEKPEVDVETTSKIYVDLLIVEETYRGLPDSLIINKVNVFEKYNSTEEEYNKTYLQMKNDKEIWNDFFESSLAYLDTLRTRGTNVKIDSSQVRL